MIGLCLVKRTGGKDWRYDLALQRCTRRRFCRLGAGHLGFVQRKDRCPVAIPPVTELPARIRRIDRAKEQPHDLIIADPGIVKSDLHRLIMSGAASRHLLVAGVLQRPARITRNHPANPFHPFEIGFHAPKAAPCNDGLFGCSLRGLGQAQQQGSQKAVNYPGHGAYSFGCGKDDRPKSQAQLTPA